MFDNLTAPRPRPTWYAAKRPLELLTWSESITPYVNPAESVDTAMVQIAPSGTGEMQVAAFSVVGQDLFVTFVGGQPTRIYTIQYVVTMSDGSVYQPTAQIACQGVLLTDQPQVPPSPGFGPVTVWTFASSFDFSDVRNSWLLAAAWGLG